MNDDDSGRHQENSTECVGRGEYRIHTGIEIDAPADVTWATLTDFDNYDWSSSFKGLSGPVAPDAEIVAVFNIARYDIKINHKLIEVEPGVQWAWSAPFALGMADHHVYRVEPVDEHHSRFIQKDCIGGGAAVVAGKLTAKFVRRLYQTFNAELKAETERRHSA